MTKSIALPVLVCCVLGCLFMVFVFIDDGSPLAAFNAIWAAGLIVWAGWLLRRVS
jgi:hypothetical protein